MSLFRASRISAVVLIVVALPWTSFSWTTSSHLQKSIRSPLSSFGRRIEPRQQTSTRILHVLAGGPFFGPEEEFDCPDEDECEIDWDLMPGFGDDDEEETKIEPAEAEASLSLSMTPPSSFGEQVAPSFDKGRVHLEVNWQIDECVTDADTCADFCTDCVGTGRMECRFCRGSTFVAFGNDVRSCLVCSAEGREDCASCRGTGHIAPWASTMSQFQNSTTPESSI